MGHNKSPLAFDDCREALDRALAAAKGIRIPCPSIGSALTLRQRLNYFRKIDRDMNAKIYQPDDPMYKRSAYDGLVMRIPKGEATVYVEKRRVEDLTIEEIE